jgi:hypothetical protein
MKSTAAKRVAIALTTSAALVTATSVPAVAASASTPLHCHASVSDATPEQYTDVYVHVRTRPHAHVHTVAHYKTTKTPHNASANRRGRATIDYYISDATPGYRVHVDVAVRKHHRIATAVRRSLRMAK